MGRSLNVGMVVAAALIPMGLVGQGWEISAAAQQSFSDIGVLESPVGFRLGASKQGLLGPLGLQLSLDRVSEGSIDEDGFCPALLPCVPGPLDRAASLSTARIGLMLDTELRRGLDVSLGIHAILADFRESATNTEGTRVDGSDSGTTGFGASLEVTLPEVIQGLRPLLYGRLDRLGSESCPQDISCFFADPRNVQAVGIGVAWRLR